MRLYLRGRNPVSVLSVITLAVSIHIVVSAQVGQNINVITGSDDQFTGDMFRQRQNESVGGISSINPSHIMVAYNDYRTVDYLEDAGAIVPPSLIGAAFQKILRFLTRPWRSARARIGEEEEEAGGRASAQAFIGLSFSDNGGKDWYTGLHPGHRSLPPAVGVEAWDQSEMLRAYEAASDPVMATTDRQFFIAGIAFNPGAGSVGFVSRFTDLNNTEIGQNIQFNGTRLLITQTSPRFFVDKPSIAAALGADGKTYVYAAFVVFEQSDPLTSKIQLFRSTDGGVTWSGGSVVSEPLTRNQSPWIVIDPNVARTMYIGWRVFSARPPGVANAIVGKKSTNGGVSFTTSVPYPVAVMLKAFDQPQADTNQNQIPLPIPRSNAYPTATIDGNGVIHLALQEYVYPANSSSATLRGTPLSVGLSPSVGVPRVTVTSSANGGVSWTPRTAIDLANGAGTQFMPVITAVGEPGPSCSGSAGRPRSRVMVMYYDARNGGAGLSPGGSGYVAGGNTQFDVRIAEASACIKDGQGRLIFGSSQQLSRYSRSSVPPNGIVTTPGYGYTAVNRAYEIFCGGFCSFSGDYIHLIARQPYMQTPTGWKLTTATGVDQSKIPAPVVQGYWADTRNVILPTVPDPLLPLGHPRFIDGLPFWNYQSPGTGKLPGACDNPGSRDQNVYSAEYAPANLFAGAPITFRADNIPHAYPLFVENRAAVQRFFRLTIRGAAASFDYRSFDRTLPSPPPPDTEADIVIGAFSSVTGSVVIDAGAVGPIVVSVEELASTTDPATGVITSNGQLLPGGAKTSVTLLTAGDTTPTATETHAPVVAATPIVTRPFAGQLDPEHPMTMTPFTQQPFTQQSSIVNPFTQQPFTQQTAVYDVIDITFPVTLDGDQAAAAAALLAVQNAEQMTGNYLFQVIISRVSLTPGLDGCRSVDRVEEQQVSQIRAPFTQQPFTQQPFTQQPFTQQPFTQQPFTQQPFTQQPFTQQSSPSDPVYSNSTFYLAPSPTPGQSAGLRLGSGGPDRVAGREPVGATLTPVRLQAPPAPPDWRAQRSDLGLTYTLRAFQIAFEPRVTIVDPVTGQANVGVTVVSDTPEVVVINGVPQFDPAGPPASGGGAGVPVALTFLRQPVTGQVGQTLAEVRIAVTDGFGRTLTGLPATPVTVAIGDNPSGGILSGTRTVNTVQGVATFTDLSIDQIGTAYTLVATSPNLRSVESAPFNVVPLPSANETMLNTDFASFGFGNMRGTGTGAVTVTGISGTVTRALLLWNGPTNSTDPAANAAVTFGGSPVFGANSGFAHDNCWFMVNSQSYRADVTGLVTGNGSYALSDFLKVGPPRADINGVSLVVFYDDGNPANNRDVYLLSTNDSNEALAGFDAANWSSTISGVVYVGGVGVLQVHVSDGQGYGDGGVLLNGVTILGAGPNFQGNTVPPTVGQIPPTEQDGGKWDIRSFSIPAGVLTTGANNLTLTSPKADDCLSLVVMIVSVPHQAPPPDIIGANVPVVDEPARLHPPSRFALRRGRLRGEADSAR